MRNEKLIEGVMAAVLTKGEEPFTSRDIHYAWPDEIPDVKKPKTIYKTNSILKRLESIGFIENTNETHKDYTLWVKS